MRIVAGAFRGRPLAAPAGHDVRPTAERTRQAIFNVLEHAAWSPGLDGARVIDLFAGSGALGFEALSRGAEACLFVDTAPVARAAIRANAERLGTSRQVRTEAFSAVRLPAKPPGEPEFDLAFADPPYATDVGAAALQSLESGRWLRAGAIVVLEQGARSSAPLASGFVVLDERRWGAARVKFLQHVGG